MKGKHNAIDKIALLFIIIGALNWGLIGFFEWNLVDAIFSVGSMGSTIVYDVVGLSAIYMLVFSCKSCMAGCKK